MGFGRYHLQTVGDSEGLTEMDEGLEAIRLCREESHVVCLTDAGDQDGSHVKPKAEGVGDVKLGVIN